ncbi:MAG: class I SAM-dependent methyltransferase [Microthrixaceae bacterium]
MKNLRTDDERDSETALAAAFETSPSPTVTKLANFPRYVRRQDLKRFLVRYELFKHVLNVKGSIIECGVHEGFGLMSWYHCSTTLEPENLTRRIVGFDTFSGFPSLIAEDQGADEIGVGDLAADSEAELQELVEVHDRNRFLGHIEKVRLVRGDAAVTMPAYLEAHPETVVSLLFLDFDLYEPTRAALETFLPRMPRGAVIAFDELDNPRWPGETLAAMDAVGLNRLELTRLPWDPYVSWARVG